MSMFPETDTGRAYLYFIYHVKELPTVSKIAARMSEDGCNICADENGTELNENSLNKIRNAAACVVFAARSAVCSHKFRSTLTAAVSLGKPVVAVFTENVNLTLCQKLQFARADIVEWKGEQAYGELYAFKNIAQCRIAPKKPLRLKFTITRSKTGESAEISGVEYAVGRSEAMTDFTVRGNSAISRLHIVIKADDKKCVIVDQNSSNATYINGRELTPMVDYEVKNGDIVELADEKFTITSVEV